MSAQSGGTQPAIEDFLGNVEDSTESAESAETPVSEFERLTGVTTVTERQQDDMDRVVDDTATRDVARAMEDSHDYSDCGGAGDHQW